MRTHDNKLPSVGEVGRGDVKTPPLWHTVAKMPGQRWYTDGSFRGPFPLMASSMELEKDRSFDELSKVVVPIIKDEFQSVIQHLRPPRYPYAIDRALAERGRALFYSSDIGCSGCRHLRWTRQRAVAWRACGRRDGSVSSRRRLQRVRRRVQQSPLARKAR
jgi:hypothetical protein